MIIEYLVFTKVRKRFLERSYTPLIKGVRGIRPDPFTIFEKRTAASICPRSTKGGCIMGTSAEANDIINDAEIGKSDKLVI